MEYLDFELEIGPGEGREYPVAVVRSPAGEARETEYHGNVRGDFVQLAKKYAPWAVEQVALGIGGG